MNFLLFIILSGRSDSPLFVLGISFIFGVLLPIIVFVFLRKKKKIINDDATIKEERTLPYLIGAFFCLTAAVIFYLAGTEILFVVLWSVYFATSILITLINKYWKISAHAMGAGIPFGVLIFLGNDFYLLYGLFLFLIFWARLTLRVHTPAQVFWGAALGSILPIIILRIAL